MWVIHIKSKGFCKEEKHFLGREEREYIDREIFYKKIKLVS